MRPAQPPHFPPLRPSAAPQDGGAGAPPSLTALTQGSARTGTQAAGAIAAIKDYIISQGLAPGDPLPTESQLCAHLGVSRSSVREAVRTLVALDIVEVRHGHGTFVGQASMRPMVESLVFRGLMDQGEDYRGLREVVEVRLTLDLAMADAVVAAWRSRQDVLVDEVVARMETLAAQGQTFTDEDRLFHSQLLAAVPNQLYRNLVEAFWAAHTLTVPLLGAPRPADILDTANAHRAMLEAARAGDVSAYRTATRSHYAPLLRALGAS